MKTKDWQTEANVMAALGALGHTAEHLAIFDDVDLLRQKLETFAPDVLFNLVEQFRERVAFVHEKYASDAITEEYIEGRELYVGLMGNVRLTVFPIRELVFREVPPNEPKIATYKAKWDEEYRKRWGLQNQFAEGLDPALIAQIEETCKRIYRLLTIDGYARIDLRLTAANELYFIEANPNPILAEDEDFALSAGKAGLPYPKLIDRIIRQGMNTLRD